MTYGDGRYRAEVWERDPSGGGRAKFCDLADLLRVDVDVTLNATGTATLEVAVPHDRVEAARLAGVRTVRFEVDVWRDTTLIWSGVIVRRRDSRAKVTFTGRGFSWWLTRRFVRDRLVYENEFDGVGLEDVAVIARRAIESALTIDDPLLLRYLVVTTGGQVGSARAEPADRPYAADLLEDLEAVGLLWVEVGRTLLVSSTGSLGVPPLGVLTDADFTDQVEVVEDGELAASLVAVMGDGHVGEAGAFDPWIGLVEQRFDARQSDLAVLDTAAAQQVGLRRAPPVFVDMPSETSLSPQCRVPAGNLVPGAMAELHLDATLTAVRQPMRLQAVSWLKDGVSPEKVSVRFEPTGAIAALEAT